MTIHSQESLTRTNYRKTFETALTLVIASSRRTNGFQISMDTRSGNMFGRVPCCSRVRQRARFECGNGGNVTNEKKERARKNGTNAIFARNRALEWPRFGIGKQKIRGARVFTARASYTVTIYRRGLLHSENFCAPGSRNMRIFRERVIIRTFGAINSCSL